MQLEQGLEELASRIANPDIPGYVLVLGTGCAKAAGVPSITELQAQFGAEADDPEALESLISDVPVPSFYHEIASMARSGHLPIVITTTFDRLLERALLDSGLRPGSHYTVVELAADPAEQRSADGYGVRPPITLIRCNRSSGDQSLNGARIDAAIGRSDPAAPISLVLAGYGFDCPPLEHWGRGNPGGEAWWIAEDAPDRNEVGRLGWNAEMRVIDGPAAAPEQFFGQLALVLLRLPLLRSLRSQDLPTSSGDDWLDEEFKRSRLQQAKTVKRAIEGSYSSSAADPGTVSQLAYQTQEIGRLEQELATPQAASRLVQRFKIARDHLDRLVDDANSPVDTDTVAFVDAQVDSLEREAAKKHPSRPVMAAAESALDTLETEAGLPSSAGERA